MTTAITQYVREDGANVFVVEAKQVVNAIALINNWPVHTQADLDDLGKGLREFSARLKWLKEQRESRTRAPLDELESIRSEYREVEGAYADLKKACDARIVRYHQEQRAAENAARALALSTQEQAHAASRAGATQAAEALQTHAFQAMSAAPPAMKTEGVHTRKEWRTQITNPSLVPRNYLVPDEAKILDEVRWELKEASSVGNGNPALAEAARQVVIARWNALGVAVFIHETAVAR